MSGAQKEDDMTDQKPPTVITPEVLAEALRILQNPGIQDRMAHTTRQPPVPETKIACVSPSGARFMAVVVASRTHPANGRVVRIEDYLYPPHPALLANGYACHDGAEFEFPRGMTVVFQAGERRGQMTTDAKMFLTHSTWLADLARYNGREFDPTIRADKQRELAKLREAQRKEHDDLVAKMQAGEAQAK